MRFSSSIKKKKEKKKKENKSENSNVTAEHDEDSEISSKVKKMKPHVPGIVTFADHNRKLPWTVTYHAVVMFADISGKVILSS